jgi:SAM-dependent methyltransferase
MTTSCPVCGAAAPLIDVMDLNKTCGVEKDIFLPASGIPVYYALCSKCGFCFAPALHAWTLEEFSRWIYNDDYALYDPGYLQERPLANSKMLRSIFPDLPSGVRHLDYGGGNGILAKSLTSFDWSSTSYDPFVDMELNFSSLGTFDLITAFEVFEHVPNVQKMMSEINSLLAVNGILVFSTLLSDGNIHKNQRINWWYAAPRNGHISLFSCKSLVFLARVHGLNFGSVSNGLHVLWKGEPPAWAGKLFAARA